MSTTSGCKRAVSSTAAATVPASPTTSMPAWRLNNVCRPSRTTLWSSTIINRIGLDSGGFIQLTGGDFDRDARAFARRGQDFAACAQFARPRGNISQPMTAAGGRPLFKTHSIVEDFQPHAAVLSFQCYHSALRAGMPQTVGHGFARYLQQVRGLPGVQRFGRARINVKGKQRRVGPAHGGNQGLQSSVEITPLQRLRLQTDNEIPHVT